MMEVLQAFQDKDEGVTLVEGDKMMQQSTNRPEKVKLAAAFN